MASMGHFEKIQDSIARSNEYGAEGSGYQGTFVNGELAVSRSQAESMTSESEYNSAVADALGSSSMTNKSSFDASSSLDTSELEKMLAEILGQGIIRQGGNY